MNDSNTAVATAPAAKKATKKAAPKKAVKKAAAKKAPVARAKKDGLRKPQVRILAALAKHGEMTRAKISEKAPVDSAYCTVYIGSTDSAVRDRYDKEYYPCLLTLKYVTAKAYPTGENDVDGPLHYTITAAGKKALEKAS